MPVKIGKPKPKHFVIGAPTVESKPVFFQKRMHGNNEFIQTEECGPRVTFENMPGFVFYLHPGYSAAQNFHGYAVTEEQTGMRVAIDNTPDMALSLAKHRLEQFVSKNGIDGLARLIKQQGQVTKLHKGYNGTQTKIGPKRPLIIPPAARRAISEKGKAAALPVHRSRIGVRLPAKARN